MPNLEQLYLSINLTLPEVTIIGYYNLNGMLLKIFPLYGNGNFEINATEVCIAGKGQLHFTNETLQMSLLKLDLSWHQISMSLENFLKGGDFSDVLQRVVPGVGKDVFLAYKPFILEKLECALTNKINEKLNDPLLKDIIKGIIPDE